MRRGLYPIFTLSAKNGGYPWPWTAQVKSKKTIVIAIILFVVAGLTAVIGLRAMTKEVVKVAKAATSGFKPPVFVKAGRYVLPIIRGDRVTAQISMGIMLEVRDEADKAKVKERMRILKDAFFSDLNKLSIWRDYRTNRFAPLPIVKARLMKITRDIVGPDIVHAVLVTYAIRRNL